MRTNNVIMKSEYEDGGDVFGVILREQYGEFVTHSFCVEGFAVDYHTGHHFKTRTEAIADYKRRATKMLSFAALVSNYQEANNAD